jgi:hypothetical protein
VQPCPLWAEAKHLIEGPLPRPLNQRRYQFSAKYRPAKIVDWQVSRKRLSVLQSFAAASALGAARSPAAIHNHIR